MAMRRVLVISAVALVLLAGGLAGWVALRPSATQAARSQAGQPAVTVAAGCCRCPRAVLPLPAEGVARAAGQARIQAPALYKGFGPAVVELAWRAAFRLSVWASAPFQCSNQIRQRTVVVDLLFPKMLPSASLSQGVVLVSRFRTGYRVWEAGH
jgi:hypothetical protein